MSQISLKVFWNNEFYKYSCVRPNSVTQLRDELRAFLASKMGGVGGEQAVARVEYRDADGNWREITDDETLAAAIDETGDGVAKLVVAPHFPRAESRSENGDAAGKSEQSTTSSETSDTSSNEHVADGNDDDNAASARARRCARRMRRLGRLRTVGGRCLWLMLASIVLIQLGSMIRGPPGSGQVVHVHHHHHHYNEAPSPTLNALMERRSEWQFALEHFGQQTNANELAKLDKYEARERSAAQHSYAQQQGAAYVSRELHEALASRMQHCSQSLSEQIASSRRQQQLHSVELERTRNDRDALAQHLQQLEQARTVLQQQLQQCATQRDRQHEGYVKRLEDLVRQKHVDDDDHPDDKVPDDREETQEKTLSDLLRQATGNFGRLVQKGADKFAKKHLGTSLDELTVDKAHDLVKRAAEHVSKSLEEMVEDDKEDVAHKQTQQSKTPRHDRRRRQHDDDDDDDDDAFSRRRGGNGSRQQQQQKQQAQRLMKEQQRQRRVQEEMRAKERRLHEERVQKERRAQEERRAQAQSGQARIGRWWNQRWKEAQRQMHQWHREL